MQRDSNHYATLGLDRHCTVAQIRAAYRVLAKQHHPDLNPNSPEAVKRIQELNLAHEILSDAARRSDYDRELNAPKKSASRGVKKSQGNISQDVQLRLEDFFRGTSLDVRVNDPGNADGPEIYQLTIPPGSAPGARFRLQRTSSSNGGFVVVRVRTLPNFRFKVRGSDLRCDLRINAKRAAQGGEEMLRGALGSMLRVKIPVRVARGDIIRMAGEGMPNPRGGRGDLLVRIIYTPEVRITRTSGR